MGAPIGWHRANGMRRCSRCLKVIAPKSRYFGDYREPLRILCQPCKTGHIVPNVSLAPMAAR